MKVSRFLLSYRSTPNTTTGRTPSELFLKCQIRTRLDLLKPSVPETVAQSQSQQKYHHDKQSHMRNFEIGTHVLAQNFRGTSKWLPGVIVGKSGNVSYQVKVGSKIWNRHIDQILQGNANLPTIRSNSPVDATTFSEEDTATPQELPNIQTTPESGQDTTASTSMSLETASTPGLLAEESRYPHRLRKVPDCFTPAI